MGELQAGTPWEREGNEVRETDGRPSREEKAPRARELAALGERRSGRAESREEAGAGARHGKGLDELEAELCSWRLGLLHARERISGGERENDGRRR
jgi:hypothetical protein